MEEMGKVFFVVSHPIRPEEYSISSASDVDVNVDVNVDQAGEERTP